MCSDPKKSKMSEIYSELAAETRKLVFDQMTPGDRDRFGLCSTNERAPKQIYGLELYGMSRDHWTIYVIHDKYDNYKDRKNGYTMDFDGKYATCIDLESKELWIKELEASTDIFQLALGHFKNLLNFQQTSIKKLVVCGYHLENFDFGVEKLEKLEDLNVEGDASIEQFLKKTGQPLRKLRVHGLKNSKDLASCEEIYQVKDLLNVPGLKLNNDQFRAVSAKVVRISIGELTAENIADFIKHWKNKDTVITKPGDYQWILDNPNFNEIRLFDLLEFFDHFRHENLKTIRSDDYNKEAGELFYSKQELNFSYGYKEPTPRQRRPRVAPEPAPVPEAAPAPAPEPVVPDPVLIQEALPEVMDQ